ncbi:ExbD/TolR family protein [Confluentibacter citreus]|uniref:ExbD/TolR family protein n=1 Tax=Confluentibacter citreus TaxID=2007307 RepID=UPI000C28FC1F|nr:biopolymer transporter ExbD [Confluentibacter citreus]
MAKRAAPEVNAGSMADIAFLLLIFFLVTTTIPKDSGISRKLPPIDDTETEPPIIRQKNIFTVLINNRDQLMVEENLMEIKDLRAAAVEFLDNNGDGTCSFCQGKRDPSSSDNPTDKAVISLANERETSYAAYISVQNELVAAYNELRNRRALEIGSQKGFPNMNFLEMQAKLEDVRWGGNKTKLKEVIEQIQVEIPQKLSEVAK